MKILFVVLALLLPAFSSQALEVFNLNVFDQLQGDWKPGFRDTRMKLVSGYVRQHSPDLVVFEEARGVLTGAEAGGEDSADAKGIALKYPYRKYVHEMTGKDGASYGYWMGAKREPRIWIEGKFSFPGGVERKVLGGIWDKALGKKCLGVVGLHLSYQSSEVRQKEALWLLNWLKIHESACPQWLVLGDFNADASDREMKILFDGGLKPLFGKTKPTVGAFNPIRRIYGEKVPSQTIDWALGWNLNGNAEVVLDAPVKHKTERNNAFAGWVSDHAGILVHLKK